MNAQVVETTKSVASLVPANRTASANGSAVDCRGFHTAKVLLSIGAFTAGTLDVTVEESDDGVGGWTAVTGAAFAQAGTADANKSFVGEVQCSDTKRFLRAVGTMASTPDADFAVLFELGNAETKPVSQSQTVAFQV